jgi:hypothetical protein
MTPSSKINTLFVSPSFFELAHLSTYMNIDFLFFSPQFLQAFLSFQGCITGTTIITIISSEIKTANITHFLLLFWSFLAFINTAVPASVYSAALATWSTVNGYNNLEYEADFRNQFHKLAEGRVT